MTQPASIPFFLHDLGQAELDSVAEVLRGPILTTGETVKEFERQFASYLGRKHALGTTSCTGAMHMALVALGIGAGDEVITTPMTFIATATAIIEAGAKPIFVDVEPETGNLDVTQVEAAITPRTKAIIPVHLYGLMCDMRELKRIASKHGLKIIEDCAHALESSRDGIRPGDLSEVACFSFFATKAITSGEGGALVTDDTTLFERLQLIRSHGMNKTAADRHREGYQHWDMPIFGWKYNMDNIQAALLLPQMQRIESALKKRQQIAAAYEEGLKSISGIHFPKTLPTARHARHLFTIWIKNAPRDLFLQKLQTLGIPVVVNYRAIHLLTYFKETLGHSKGDFPNAEKIGDETLSLPLYPRMPLDHVQRVIESVRQVALQADS